MCVCSARMRSMRYYTYFSSSVAVVIFFLFSIFNAYYFCYIFARSFSLSLAVSLYNICCCWNCRYFCLRNNISTDIKLMVIWWSFFLSLLVRFSRYLFPAVACFDAIMLKTCSLLSMSHFMFFRFLLLYFFFLLLSIWIILFPTIRFFAYFLLLFSASILKWYSSSWCTVRYKCAHTNQPTNQHTCTLQIWIGCLLCVWQNQTAYCNWKRLSKWLCSCVCACAYAWAVSFFLLST